MSIFDIFALLKQLSSAAPEVISVIVTGLTSAIAIALVIPGDQPEKILQKLVDYLSKWSRK